MNAELDHRCTHFSQQINQQCVENCYNSLIAELFASRDCVLTDVIMTTLVCYAYVRRAVA